MDAAAVEQPLDVFTAEVLDSQQSPGLGYRLRCGCHGRKRHSSLFSHCSNALGTVPE